MKFETLLVDELVKNGRIITDKDNIVWSVSNHSLLYKTPEQAEAFLKMRTHPRYRKVIVKIETDLIKKHAEKNLPKSTAFNLIDVGCCDGAKANAFIESFKGNGKIRYCAVSPNEQLVNLAIKNVKKNNFKNVTDYLSQVENLDSLDKIGSTARNSEYQKNTILLLGSILAAFEIHDYLFSLSMSMFKGDALVIGNGIRTGERLANLETYKHSVFKDWLIEMVKNLGFKKNEVEYGVRFANKRVEGFFRVKNDKTISDGKKIQFRKGDEILVAYLYKYFENELVRICKRYFSNVKLVKDEQNEYALIFCTK